MRKIDVYKKERTCDTKVQSITKKLKTSVSKKKLKSIYNLRYSKKQIVIACI